MPKTDLFGYRHDEATRDGQAGFYDWLSDLRALITLVLGQESYCKLLPR